MNKSIEAVNVTSAAAQAYKRSVITHISRQMPGTNPELLTQTVAYTATKTT